MTKQNIREVQSCYLEGKIDDMIYQLTKWKNEGWEVVSDDIFIELYKIRLETDEEYNHRMSNEKIMKERAEAQRRKQYEKLREEFGND